MLRSLFIALVMPSVVFSQVSPEKAEATMKVAAGLECKLFASEPMFVNPTCMDIDEKGRVWVCESINYRCKLRNIPFNRPEGDRIVILHDTDGDGKADKATTFYQAPDFLAPLGIAVLKEPKGPGYKVWVCHSPHIYLFEDKDGDGKADGPPKIFLTGFKGYDHDHGVHGIHFGPDGMLYFSVGDQGVDGLKDKFGKIWKTNQTDCKAGTIWRVNTDGTGLELLAHNFRNQYEPAVNSFGTMFVSDNDDDGNEQTRICHVMYGGDYGYWPRRKGDHHWHEDQPGVVHKVMRTGFGSPTGLCWYEGDLLYKALLNLLPAKDKSLYKGLLLHTDAGPRELRCFGVKEKGAGYEADKLDLITSSDNWFRPSDVCVAPDGSIFISDWYDPGVGGHGMGDTTRGRIYRITPKGSTKYEDPNHDLQAEKGFHYAIASPNISSRQAALEHARNGSWNGFPIANRYSDSHLESNPWYNSRLFFAWSTSEHFREVIPELVKNDIQKLQDTKFDESTDFKYCWGFGFMWFGDRYWPELGTMISSKAAFHCFVKNLKRNGNSSRLAPLLRYTSVELVKEVFWTIAEGYDGSDRFYLSALNIALGTDPVRRQTILADFEKHYPEWNDKVAKLVWELRPAQVIAKLPELLQSDRYTPKQRAFMFEIMANSDDPEIGRKLLEVIAAKESSQELQKAATKVMTKHLAGKWSALKNTPETTTAIRRMFAWPFSTPLALELVAASERSDFIKQIIRVIDDQDPGLTPAMKKQAVETLGTFNHPEAIQKLTSLLPGEHYALVITALGNLKQFEVLEKRLEAKDLRTGEANAILTAQTSSRPGTQRLFDHVSKLEAFGLGDTAKQRLMKSPYPDLRNRALMLFQNSAAKLDLKKLPTLTELAKRNGNIERGKKLVMEHKELACARCHTINNEGGKIGPDLSQIGTKASRENLLESLLYPDKAIADQFAQFLVENRKGEQLTGLIVEETPERIVIRDANGKDSTVAIKDIVERKKSAKSLMPDDLYKFMTEQDLMDMVEYMTTLKKP